MDKYAEVDRSNFPLVLVRFTGAESTDENFGVYLDELLHLYDEKEPVALVFDARKASLPALKHQKQQANWLKENETLLKDYCKGTAYVISSAAVRAILKVIFSFYAQPAPYKVFSSMGEAEKWTWQRLRQV